MASGHRAASHHDTGSPAASFAPRALARLGWPSSSAQTKTEWVGPAGPEQDTGEASPPALPSTSSSRLAVESAVPNLEASAVKEDREQSSASASTPGAPGYEWCFSRTLRLDLLRFVLSENARAISKSFFLVAEGEKTSGEASGRTTVRSGGRGRSRGRGHSHLPMCLSLARNRASSETASMDAAGLWSPAHTSSG